MLTLEHSKAVLEAQEDQNASFFAPLHLSKEWTQVNERIYCVVKVETHNHPTAISPFPGAATGVRIFWSFFPRWGVKSKPQGILGAKGSSCSSDQFCSSGSLVEEAMLTLDPT